MKKNLMSLGVLALFGMATVTLSAAPVSCDSLVGSGTSVLTLNNGGAGCTEDGLLFNNFAVSNASSGTGTAEVDVTSENNGGGTTNPMNGIYISGGQVYFNLNPNLGGSTIGGTITDLHLTFTVSGGVGGADLSVGGINGEINETDCGTNPGGSPCTDTVWNTVDGSGASSSCSGNVANPIASSNTPCAFGTSVPEIWVFKDISIASTSAHLTNFTESFQTAPEPMTTSLVGMGLLGIGFLGRRLRK